MTPDEAKFILGACRPGGGDDGLPAFGDAVRMASSDPALGAWFARSRAHDGAVAAKLRQIEPPAGLREAILAGARASGPTRAPGRGWAWAAGLGAAAGLALILFSMKIPARPSPGALATFAIADLADPNHGGRGDAAKALVASLERAGPPMPGQVDFETLRDTGCRTLSVAGREVLEVCFSRDGTSFHFYVARRSGATGEPARGGPSFVAGAAGAAAVWSDGRFDYAISSAAGVGALRKLFFGTGGAAGPVDF